MRLYVCRPTNARSVAACNRHGFGALLSPISVRSARESWKIIDMSGHTTPLEGLPYVLDNGVWSCHMAGIEWSDEPLLRMLERLGLSDRGRYRAGLGRGFVVLPDIVGGGEDSLAFSLEWLARHRGGVLADQVASWLLAVQDGMTVERVREVLVDHKLDGLFVGGSTGWKWATVHDWAELGLELGRRVHVGRVNGQRRAELCRDLGVSSIDGSSVSRFAVNARKMAVACDGDDRALPPSRARSHLPGPLARRIVDVETRARRSIAARRHELGRAERQGLLDFYRPSVQGDLEVQG